MSAVNAALLVECAPGCILSLSSEQRRTLLAELYLALRQQVPRLVVRDVRKTKLQIAGKVAMAAAALQATTVLTMKEQLRLMDEAHFDYVAAKEIVASRARLLRPAPLADANSVALALHERFRVWHRDAVTLAAIFLGQHLGYRDAARARLSREADKRIGLSADPDLKIPAGSDGFGGGGGGGGGGGLELVPLEVASGDDDGGGNSGGSGGSGSPAAASAPIQPVSPTDCQDDDDAPAGLLDFLDRPKG